MDSAPMNIRAAFCRSLVRRRTRQPRRSAGKGRLPACATCFFLSLLSCHGDQAENTDSATSGPKPGVCYAMAPEVGGPCAPYGVIATGVYHTCALLVGGRIRCWGDNDHGQLGLGNVIRIGDDETPESAPPLDLGEAAIQLAAGFQHTCALTESGRIFCWGEGSGGRLGHGNSMDIGDDELPASAGPVPLDGTALQVAAGWLHTCALMSDGSVRCWGAGQFGKLGTGTSEDIGDDETPASQAPIDLGGRAVYIAASRDHTCAVLDAGGVICWGLGENGQLGRGNTDNIGDDETPGSVGPIDVGAAVTHVAVGSFHTCALTVGGAVKCWGSNGNGMLGSGNGYLEMIGDDEPPSATGVVSLGRPSVAIAAGGGSTCALLDDGTLMCWGVNSYGELGYGSTHCIGADDVPSDFGAIAVGGSAVQVSVGDGHACALLVDASIRCWGEAVLGALGYANTGDYQVEGSTCQSTGDFFVCDVDPVCCIGDIPGEMPPPPVQYQ